MKKIVRLFFGVVALAALATSGGSILEAQSVRIDQTLLDADSVDETSACVAVDRRTYLTVFVEWSTGVSSGVVEIEEYYTSGYTGTPAQIKQLDVADSAADATDVVHLPLSVYRTVCTRISTAIAGGTVTTRITG